MSRRKSNNNNKDKTKKLVRYHDELPDLTYPEVRRFIVLAGRENMDNLIRLKYADLYGHTKYKWDEKMEKLTSFEQMYQKIKFILLQRF